jgi:hypothetical protein
MRAICGKTPRLLRPSGEWRLLGKHIWSRKDWYWPRLCENARAPFSCVNFSHVDAISADLSNRIRVLAILRGERNEFSHSLGRKSPVDPRIHAIRDTVDDARVGAIHRTIFELLFNYRSDLKPSRISSTRIFGCSHAAKCPRLCRGRRGSVTWKRSRAYGRQGT